MEAPAGGPQQRKRSWTRHQMGAGIVATQHSAPLTSQPCGRRDAPEQDEALKERLLRPEGACRPGPPLLHMTFNNSWNRCSSLFCGCSPHNTFAGGTHQSRTRR